MRRINKSKKYFFFHHDFWDILHIFYCETIWKIFIQNLGPVLELYCSYMNFPLFNPRRVLWAGRGWLCIWTLWWIHAWCREKLYWSNSSPRGTSLTISHGWLYLKWFLRQIFWSQQADLSTLQIKVMCCWTQSYRYRFKKWMDSIYPFLWNRYCAPLDVVIGLRSQCAYFSFSFKVSTGLKFECSPCAANYIEQGTKCIGEHLFSDFSVLAKLFNWRPTYVFHRSAFCDSSIWFQISMNVILRMLQAASRTHRKTVNKPVKISQVIKL